MGLINKIKEQRDKELKEIDPNYKKLVSDYDTHKNKKLPKEEIPEGRLSLTTEWVLGAIVFIAVFMLFPEVNFWARCFIGAIIVCIIELIYWAIKRKPHANETKDSH